MTIDPRFTLVEQNSETEYYIHKQSGNENFNHYFDPWHDTIVLCHRNGEVEMFDRPFAKDGKKFLTDEMVRQFKRRADSLNKARLAAIEEYNW